MRKNLNKSRINKSLSIIIFLSCMVIFPESCEKDPGIEPKLNTLQTVDTDITGSTALLKGEILRLGDMNITEYGIEISESMYFSSSLAKGYSTAPAIGIFQVEFTDLKPVTTYYFKAYALINTAQVYSINYEQFTTKQ